MTALLVDVQIEGNAMAPQCSRELERVLDLDGRILPSMPEETGWCHGGDLLFAGQQPDQVGCWIGTEQVPFGTFVGVFSHCDYWIAEDPEIGSRTFSLDRVCCIRGPGIEMGKQTRGKVASRRGAHDSDAFRIDVPLGGARADEADGAGCIVEHRGMAVSSRTESVCEDEAGDSVLVKPERVVFPFMICEGAVSASWADNNRRAGCEGRIRQIGHEGGNVFGFLPPSAWNVTGPEGQRWKRLGQQCATDQEGKDREEGSPWPTGR
jgi:hypothetical protein